jgi:hypothetical protein
MGFSLLETGRFVGCGLIPQCLFLYVCDIFWGFVWLLGMIIRTGEREGPGRGWYMGALYIANVMDG